MKFLSIETCFGRYSVAIFAGGKLLAHFAGEEETKQAEKLVPAIEAILTEANLGYKELDAVAVGIGPGSFTGIRIGMAAAKGDPLGGGIKTIPVSTLTAAAIRKGGYPVRLNASRGEAYYQESAASEPLLVPYEGKFDEPPDATDIGTVALGLTPKDEEIEPLYIRKPDAKLPGTAPAKTA